MMESTAATLDVEPERSDVDVPPQAAPVASWTERLLDPKGVVRPPGPKIALEWGREARRLLVAFGLASLFGVALGLRVGGASMAVHALGVALGFAAVCGLAVPALAIILTLFDAAIDALGLARATARAAAAAGLLLAGLAPGIALFALTVEDAITVTLVGSLGLALAGAVGVRSFVLALAPQLRGSDARAMRLSWVALPLFLVFAAVLGARIWWVSLPLLRGG